MTRKLQPDRPRGQTLTDVYLKRPARSAFDYGRSADMLIVGDGRALTFVRWRSRSPALADQTIRAFGAAQTRTRTSSRFARVVQDDAQVLVEARDPRRREFGRSRIAFAKSRQRQAG
jgi:hypothetical protein